MKADRQVAAVEGALAGCGEGIPVRGACPTCGSGARLVEGYYAVLSARILDLLYYPTNDLLMVNQVDGELHEPNYALTETLEDSGGNVPPPFVFCLTCRTVVPLADIVVTFYKEPE